MLVEIKKMKRNLISRHPSIIETENEIPENTCYTTLLDETPETEKEINCKNKLGRKKSKDKIYFGETEEAAVKTFLTTDDDYIRNKIYREILAPAFKKMVEAIIRDRGLYVPNEEFVDTYRDALSYLLSKAHMFKPERGKRAYSYYSNITKNYLIYRRNKAQKSIIRNPSYDSSEIDFENDNNFSTESIDTGKSIADEKIKVISEKINEMISKSDEFGLKESEVKVGKALINLFENWDYVLTLDSNKSNKLNKSVVLLFLREQTGLDTKGVRENLKRYKKEYYLLRDDVID